jgi:CIC family chloride channel protein
VARSGSGIERARRVTLLQFGILGRRWRRFVTWFHGLELSENAILIAFAVAIGTIGAMGVVGFYELIDLAYALFYRTPADWLPAGSEYVVRPLVTGAGFFVAWWIMRRLGRAHDGLNVPDVQLAVARREGAIPLRPALARTAASAVTLGSGGSAGSEGPVAVLGSTVGSVLGRAFRFDASRVKVLVAAGAAAGISAAFNAPLAGAFFALEEILGSLAVSAFPAVVVSSVVAAVVSRAFFGNHPAFPVPTEYGYALVREVALFYPLLGVISGLIAVLFIRIYFRTDDVVRKLPLPPALLPWLGGIAVGLLALASGARLVGFGHLAAQLEVFGALPLGSLVLLALGKIIATSITLNTGGSGGVFTPSLFVGAACGGAFGVALRTLFPELGLSPEAYALVGMGAVVAAATDAPLTGILIVFEMTNDYGIVLPLMLSTVIAYLVARRIEPDSLYSGWLRRRGETIEHGASRDVLLGAHVADVYQRDALAIDEAATVAQLLAHLGTSEQLEFPVVDGDHRLLGMVTVGDLGAIAKDHGDLAPILLAADVATPSETVTPHDSLLVAIQRMGIRGTGSLPVVEAETNILLGLVSRGHILALYERTIAAGR